MKLVLKKKASELYYRKRYQRLTSHDQVQRRKSKQFILFLLYLKIFLPKRGFTTTLEIFLRCFMYRYLSISYSIEEPLQTRKNFYRTIDSFSASDCKINFAFNKRELRSLLVLLKFPHEVVLDNRSRKTGEEIFLRGLYELVSGGNQEQICQTVFGGVGSDQSRALAYFICHIYYYFHHLVHDNLQWWYDNGFFEVSALAIGEKLSYGNLYFNNMASHFIDCNCLPTSVVGGGPAEGGANAARWDEEIQRAFFNGWKSIHGLKHQTVDNAFGMTVDMCGPTSLRRNDLAVLRISDINNRFAAIQSNSEKQFLIFGDSAYQVQSHIRTYHRVDTENGVRGVYNTRMKKVRISIEWNYGYTATLFAYLQQTRKLKVMKSERVAMVYTVATILRNVFVGYYGCQTSNYFNLSLPPNFVEKYLKQENF